MDHASKRERLKGRIDSHLRRTARQLVMFDSLEETLHYLVDSFRQQFTCDFVAILLKENNYLFPKICKGGSGKFESAFPLPVERCSPNFLLEAVWWMPEKQAREDECDFQRIVNGENLSTWFTVPLKDEQESFGLCVIGYHQFVPLVLEAGQNFNEFGKDVAVAMSLALAKEKQNRKIKGIEWIRENLSLGSSIEQLVSNIVERAGKGTRADFACIYLYDETRNRFIYQPPSYGFAVVPEQGDVAQEALHLRFPYWEQSGGNELTVPMTVNERTIGVLYVSGKREGNFTEEDKELLAFLSNHVSALIENARLYRSELERKQRLQTIMMHHQELVRQTVEGENVDEISRSLSKLFFRSVILFDRFFRPISSALRPGDEGLLSSVCALVESNCKLLKNRQEREMWLECQPGCGADLGLWPIMGGGDLLGYLAILIPARELDEVMRLTIDHALNVYAIQFIKQKLVIEATEQVKESFVNQLLTDKLEDREKIIQYANLFKWDLFQPHRVGVFSLSLKESPGEDADLLRLESRKTAIWDRIKESLGEFGRDIILSRKGEEYIAFVPVAREKKGARLFWRTLFGLAKRHLEDEAAEIFLGVGGKTERLEDYLTSYKQAVQANRVVYHRFRDPGFALFEELGAYTVLHNLQDPQVAELLVKQYLSPLIRSAEGRTDLFHTLRVYLENGGKLKETTEALYIHRSTLSYRLEKIRELLDLDIDDAENRFHLMMAYKLYDLYYSHSSNMTKN